MTKCLQGIWKITSVKIQFQVPSEIRVYLQISLEIKANTSIPTDNTGKPKVF